MLEKHEDTQHMRMQQIEKDLLNMGSIGFPSNPNITQTNKYIYNIYF